MAVPSMMALNPIRHTSTGLLNRAMVWLRYVVAALN
jgi:hypothetical protein